MSVTYLTADGKRVDPMGQPVNEPAVEAGGAGLTVAQLKEQLTALGVEFDARANKADLVAALEAAREPAVEAGGAGDGAPTE